jgi:hypothetical protein
MYIIALLVSAKSLILSRLLLSIVRINALPSMNIVSFLLLCSREQQRGAKSQRSPLVYDIDCARQARVLCR